MDANLVKIRDQARRLRALGIAPGATTSAKAASPFVRRDLLAPVMRRALDGSAAAQSQVLMSLQLAGASTVEALTRAGMSPRAMGASLRSTVW